MMKWNKNLFFYPYFENHMPLDKPPTLFVILNSILTSENDGNRIPILDVSEQSRDIIFDFTYPLSEAVDKAVFERTWIDHFLQRRIGEETFTAFKLQLRGRFNEIMPFYNPLFDALGEQFDIFKGDGYDITIHEEESTSRDIADTGSERRNENLEQSASETGNQNTNESGTNASALHSETDGTVDNRFSDTPQNQLTNVQNGSYLTNYTFNQSDGSVDTTNNESSTNSRTVAETKSRSAEDSKTVQSNTTRSTDDDTERTLDRHEVKISNVANTDALIKYMNETRNIYAAIYHDCDDLFYQLF